MEKNAIKISDYPTIPINNTNWIGKIELDSYLLGYAVENYGPKYIRKNYKLPLSFMRTDILRYIGFDNVKPGYRNLIRLWSGLYHSDNKVLSYIYEWNDYENGNPDYIFNKFGEIVTEDGVLNDRMFMLRKAPWPAEQTTERYGSEKYGQDPYPNTMKLVDKAYLDGRFDGWRIISNSWDDSSTFVNHDINLRSYTTIYFIDEKDQFRVENPEKEEYLVNFVTNHGDQLDQRGDLNTTIKSVDKFLTFYVRIKMGDYWKNRDAESGHQCDIRFTVDGNDVEWTYRGELKEIMRQETLKDYAYLKFNLFYDADGNVRCCGGAMFGRGQKYPRVRSLGFENSESKKIPLVKYRGDDFISEYYDYYTFNDLRIRGLSTKQTISFDTDGMEGESEYKWRYFLITPIWNDIDDNGFSTWKNYRDENIQFGDEIFWTGELSCDTPPVFEPNRMYCIEFTRVLDGFIVGRVEWFVSLVKKKFLTV